MKQKMFRVIFFRRIGCWFLWPLLCLAGCDQVKRTVGVGRPETNPYLVVGEPPLVIPPDIHLRPLPEPKPGTLRPQSLPPRDLARGLLVRGQDTSTDDMPPMVTQPADPSASSLVKQAQTSAKNSENPTKSIPL